jgi:hypothetical protein
MPIPLFRTLTTPLRFQATILLPFLALSFLVCLARLIMTAQPLWLCCCLALGWGIRRLGQRVWTMWYDRSPRTWEAESSRFRAPKDLHRLSPRVRTDLVCWLLEQQGYELERLDGDLLCRRHGQIQARVVLLWNTSPVGVHQVRELVRSTGGFAETMILTDGIFDVPARLWAAQQTRVQLIDGAFLIEIYRGTVMRIHTLSALSPIHPDVPYRARQRSLERTSA